MTIDSKRPFSQLMNLEDCCCGPKDMMQLSFLDNLDLSGLRDLSKTSQKMNDFVLEYLEKTTGHVHPQMQGLRNLFRTSPIANRPIGVYLEAAHELCEQYDSLRARGCRLALIREDSILLRCEQIRNYLCAFQIPSMKGQYLEDVVGSGFTVLAYAFLESGGILEEARGKAIKLAARRGNLELVRMIYQSGPITGINLGRALKYAASNTQLKVLQYFLDQGASPLYINEAIRFAEENGHVEVLRILNRDTLS
ncbi:MAG: hypothetical protein ACI9S8_000627 [Chlamydiales bacterium]|jgi:hypothetical protein